MKSSNNTAAAKGNVRQKNRKMFLWTELLFVVICSSSNRAYSIQISNTPQSRSTFLASSAAACSSLVVNPEKCIALENAPSKTKVAEPTPRYLDYDLEMAFATGPDHKSISRKVFVRKFTGDSTPYRFPKKSIRFEKDWPEQFPFAERDFFRADQQDDISFYAVPRFVYHIDEAAVSSLTQYYRKNIKPGSRILDICSSWVSHYPVEFPKTMKRISATGMSKLELNANDQLTDYEAKDLNNDPTLPHPDASFDVVTCVVSIDYLIHPVEVLKEANRVLKPGGKVIISQSNRCFPSKAIKMWLKLDERERLELINGYFKYAGGYKPRTAFDITAAGPGFTFNPMYIVEAIKA